MDARSSEAFTPEQALAEIADVAAMRSTLRTRFEGMTWILWGLVAALQAMTLGFLEEAALSETPAGRHFAPFASHLWIAVGIVASIGVWRAAAVNFDPGIGHRRALAFFIGWPALFSVASFLNAGHSGGGALGFTIVTAVLLLAFAIVNPVRYTPTGRWTAAALAATAGVVATLVWLYGNTGYAIYAIAGTAIGVSWVAAGLYALYRG